MATGLLETGPKLDWTRDNKIFDRYQIWKEKVELIFSSALEESSSKQKVSYLRYWMVLNIGSIRIYILTTGVVSNETNTYVRMYIEEFILVDIWIHWS